MASINKYNKFLLTQMNGGNDTTGGSTAGAARVVDFDTDTIKVMLTTIAYTPSPTGHATKSSVTGEVSGTNYVAGGTAIGTPTVTDSSGTIVFDGVDTTWTQNAGGFTTARYAVIYKDTGNAATSTLIAYIDFVTNQGNVAGDLILQWNNAGIVNWT